MNIVVNVEPVLGLTSPNPGRGMLRELLRIREKDWFTLVVRRGSDRSPMLKAFLNSLPTTNWNLAVDRRTRRSVTAKDLLHIENGCAIDAEGDVYLNIDKGFLGSRALPLLTTVADLSVFRCPSHASVSWHGVMTGRFGLERMARHATRIVSLSEFTRRDLIDLFPHLSDRVQVIHCGIDDRWHATDLGDSSVLHTLAMRRPYWIWYGIITRRKNIPNLIRACARIWHGDVGRTEPDLLLVGQLGRDSRDLPGLIQQLGVADRVHFIGFQPLERLIGLVDASVGLAFPSYYEGFGLPVAEAMARGRPVMVSDRSALPEVSGDNGLQVNPDDVDEMSIALRRLADGSMDSEMLRERRHAWAGRFTHTKAAMAYSQLLSELFLQNR